MRKALSRIQFSLLGTALVFFSAFPTVLGTALPPAPRIDHEARLHHARELLAGAFDKESFLFADRDDEIEHFVYQRTLDSLTPDWKPQAHRIAETIIEEANRYGFDPLFLMAVIEQESRFRPGARGSSGELGLMQIKPATASWIGDRYGLPWLGDKALRNPIINIRFGAAYLSFLRKNFKGRTMAYVSAYNMGPGAARAFLRNQIVPEKYATKVISHYMSFYGSLDQELRVAQAKSFELF